MKRGAWGHRICGEEKKKKKVFPVYKHRVRKGREGVVRGASHLPARRGREDTKSALEELFFRGPHSP
jgi:hypothetical protein